MLGRRHPTLEVFAVEDTTAQVMWQSLGPGTLSLAVDGHVQDLVTSNGPGAATLTGLAPDSDVRVQARHPDLLWPVELRFVAADDAWLSPASCRATAMRLTLHCVRRCSV